MRLFGGLLVLGYALAHLTGNDRFPDDERGAVPDDVRKAPGGLLLWHTGFMGGK